MEKCKQCEWVLLNSLGFSMESHSVLHCKSIAIENIAKICLWGSCCSKKVDGENGVAKCKVGRGKSDLFTSKVFGDCQSMISANNFVVEIANSCL